MLNICCGSENKIGGSFDSPWCHSVVRDAINKDAAICSLSVCLVFLCVCVLKVSSEPYLLFLTMSSHLEPSWHGKFALLCGFLCQFFLLTSVFLWFIYWKKSPKQTIQQTKQKRRKRKAINKSTSIIDIFFQQIFNKKQIKFENIHPIILFPPLNEIFAFKNSHIFLSFFNIKWIDLWNS